MKRTLRVIMERRGFVRSAWALVALGAGGAYANGPKYALTDLSDVFGATSQIRLHVNDRGQVLGQGGVWTPGVGLSPVPLYPYGFNNLGLVVGSDVYDYYPQPNALLWTPGVGLTELGPGVGRGINDRGEIVGSRAPSAGEVTWHSWNWTASTGQQQPLTFPAQSTDSAAAVDINNRGEIVGVNPAGASIFTWSSSSAPGQFLGAQFATDINNVGQIAGQGADYNAFLYSPGKGLRSLGPLGERPTYAFSVNDLGQVVGIATPDVDVDLGHAFLWTEQDGMQDLNDLLDGSGEGWVLRNGFGINNSGWIVGNGFHDGQEHTPFLLTPIPEPCVVGALTVGAWASLRATGRRRRRRTPG
jgi:probable HAF family extracellular repeat protein